MSEGVVKDFFTRGIKNAPGYGYSAFQARGGRALRARSSQGSFGAPGYGYSAFQALGDRALRARQSQGA